MRGGVLFVLAGTAALVQRTLSYTPLSNLEFDHILSTISGGSGKDDVHLPSELDPTNKGGYLEPILKVRIPDTPASKEVRDHFRKFFEETLDNSTWVVEEDSFLDDTPTKKQVNFTNFIATRDPPNKIEGVSMGRLTLVAHYDSKIEPQGFLGAIDSAFPCALIMYIIAQLDKALTLKWSDTTNNALDNVGIQVLFLDGEEAFKEWTATDSIYGARHLADTWEETPGMPGLRRSRLDSIDMFVLLDLLGAKDPSIPSFYKHTDWAHKNLARLQSLFQDKRGHTASLNKDGGSSWFRQPGQFFLAGRIGDDHLPFYDFGVPVLHLIPVPFPTAWHKLIDDGAHLDKEAMMEWALIMMAFTAEYMELTGYVGK